MNIPALQGHIPDNIIALLTPEFLSQLDIVNDFRLAHFLGQCKEETGNFTRFDENLNYQGSALWQLFPHHFISEDEAMTFAHQPERIANRIYARKELGNVNQGDGWKFRGRGMIQLTGRALYEAFKQYCLNDHAVTGDDAFDFINNPDLLAILPYSLISAAWYFDQHKDWTTCDAGVDRNTIERLTRRVNGALINIELRITYTQDIYAALTK